MHISVDMIFRKQYIRYFVEAISINNKWGIIEFENRDKLNSIIRSYMCKATDRYKPMFGNSVVKLIVPVNPKTGHQGFLIIQKKSFADLENHFEDLFFHMYFEFEIMGASVKGARKELRIKFLHAFGITDDVMTEDSFRKAFDRFMVKKSAKVKAILAKNNLSAISIYKSVR